MLGYCPNYIMATPDITIYMNCDTPLAINLSLFGLGDFDEFIFTIKNYDYIDSSYVYLLRATKADMDERGELIFSIDPDTSKEIKPGAFYNFAILANAYNPSVPTEYRKLTGNGKININYGAHDLALPCHDDVNPAVEEVITARIEPTGDGASSQLPGVIIGIDLHDCTVD